MFAADSVDEAVNAPESYHAFTSHIGKCHGTLRKKHDRREEIASIVCLKEMEGRHRQVEMEWLQVAAGQARD